MPTWYKKELGDGVAAYNPSMEVQKLYIQLAATGKDMSKIGIFSATDAETNTIAIYFTPEAEVLANKYDASPSEKPDSSNGISLLVGESTLWAEHFPEYKPRSKG